MEDVAAIDWNQVVGKEARGARDDGDFGEMQEAGRHYVVTQRGILEKEKFYIPKYLVYGFDGHTLWFNITGPAWAVQTRLAAGLRRILSLQVAKRAGRHRRQGPARRQETKRRSSLRLI